MGMWIEKCRKDSESLGEGKGISTNDPNQLVVLDGQTRDALKYLVASLDTHVFPHYPFTAVKGADGASKNVLFELNLETSHLLSLLLCHLGPSTKSSEDSEMDGKVLK